MSPVREIGHPQLIQELVTEIQDSGRISFARFMEQALYHEQFGYYMTQRDGTTDASAPRIGWKGDYVTTPHFHTFLAKSLVRQIREMDECLGYPDSFVIVEMGAGAGLLARDVLRECATTVPDLYHRLTYLLIERSPAMRVMQKHAVHEFSGPEGCVSWVNSLDELGDALLTGVLFSNELVDAFPVHRICIKRGTVQEVFVEYQDDQFIERLSTPSTAALESFVSRWGIPLVDGYTTEVNLQAVAWMKDVARVLAQGFVVTIDYGHTARDYFAPERNSGTLVGYYRHQFETNPYERVGLQDLTAHVNFSSLVDTGEAVGLQCTGFTDLQHFLLSVGIEAMLKDCDQEGEEVKAAAQLWNPRGMERTFTILIQQKGLSECPELSGLRYRPFFEDVLECGESVVH